MRLSNFALGLVAYAAAPGLAFWRMSCPGRIVTERIDPIVDPGAVSGHVHTVSGGNGFDFSMTYEDTQSSTCSSCPIKKDFSNYWTPSLYYRMKNGSLQYVPQSGDGIGVYGGMTVYYLQRGGPNNDNLTAYPKGFRMLAGDMSKRAYTSDFAGQAVSFVCLNYSSTSPYFNKFPNVPCPDGLRAQIFFPSCWDGVNLDSPDHKSHMAYPTKYSYDNGPCPATHPVHMISVFYEIIYSTIGFDWWKPEGAEQPFVWSSGDSTGYGFHGDFLNGWDVPTLQNATNICTADSGRVEDCPVFDFFTNDECQACIIAPKIKEQVTGIMPNLPGCNPITGFNDTVVGDGSCGSNETSTIGSPLQYHTNVTGWTYIGCGSDNGVNRTFNEDKWWSNSVTVEGCMDYCKSRGFPYAGLEYSTQCFCGSTLPASRAPVPRVLGNCFSPCAGDSSQFCGGANRLSIYYNNGTYVPVSNSISNSVPRLPVCPNSNNTMYNATNTAQFMVQCGVDRAGGDIRMVGVTAGNITACMENCAGTTGCTYVALSGGACYMKAGTNLRAVSNSGIRGAYLISAGTIVSTSSSAAGTGTSTGTATSTAVASSTATMCPGADGQVINNYTVRCTSDSSVGSYSNSRASVSYLDCMTSCDGQSNNNCLGFVYVGGANGLGSGTCWLKTAMGTITQGGGPNYIAAFKARVVRSTTAADVGGSTVASSATSSSGPSTASSASPASSASAATEAGTTSTAAPTCPGSNSTYYSASTGATFLIECGIDHAGGDMGSLSVSSFQQCIEACASTSGCVDVSLSGVACYLKRSVGRVIYSSGIRGARLIQDQPDQTAPAIQAKFMRVAAVSSSTVSTKKSATTSKKTVTTTKKTATTSKKTATTKKTASTATRKAAATSNTSKTTKASTTIKTTTRQTKTSASPSSTVTKVACPSHNQTFYFEPQTGLRFFLECGIDYKGGNLTSLATRTLSACINRCALNDKCVDVTFSKGICYLKKKLGTVRFGTSFNGARLLGPRPSSTTTTTADPTTSTSNQSSATTDGSVSDAPAATTTGSAADTSTSSPTTVAAVVDEGQ